MGHDKISVKMGAQRLVLTQRGLFSEISMPLYNMEGAGCARHVSAAVILLVVNIR